MDRQAFAVTRMIGQRRVKEIVLESLNAGILLGPEPGITREKVSTFSPGSTARKNLAQFEKSRFFAL